MALAMAAGIPTMPSSPILFTLVDEGVFFLDEYVLMEWPSGRFEFAHFATESQLLCWCLRLASSMGSTPARESRCDRFHRSTSYGSRGVVATSRLPAITATGRTAAFKAVFTGRPHV